jgi:hypothetical protein
VTSGAYLFLILALVLAGGTWLTLRLERLEREIDRLRAALQQAEQPAGVAPPTRDREMRAPEPVLPTASFFERLVGGRLLIWTGGVALAAAGIFLIRHSIELVTPAARMIASALLGAALIVAGEYARRGRFLSDDPRIAQALVGAGLAVLYATAYGSHILFGLIGGGTAFVLMVAITAAALGLSLRHGLPTAALGLIGGVLAPALVGDADAGALPVLAYLALLDAAVFALAWRRGWGWLAAVAVLASFAWTGVFVLGEAEDAWPAALFAGLLGVIASLPRREEGRAIGFVQPMVLALIQAAVLVGRSDVGAGAWLLFGGLAAAGLVLAAIRPSEKLAPAAALFLALILIGAEAEGDPFTPYAALGTALLLGGGGAWLAVRGQRKQTLVACAALAGPLLLMRMIEPDLIGRAGYGTLALVAAGLALGLLALLRRAADRSRPKHNPARTDGGGRDGGAAAGHRRQRRPAAGLCFGRLACGLAGPARARHAVARRGAAARRLGPAHGDGAEGIPGRRGRAGRRVAHPVLPRARRRADRDRAALWAGAGTGRKRRAAQSAIRRIIRPNASPGRIRVRMMVGATGFEPATPTPPV